MRKRLSMTVLVASLLFSGMVTEPSRVTAGQPQTKGGKEHRFKIGKLNKKWKVFDSANSNNRVITASAGETVIWSAAGSDAFFQFPDETIFGTADATVADGEELTLTVSANVKPGRYTYSIFCAADNQFATGDSPPVIIIK